MSFQKVTIRLRGLRRPAVRLMNAAGGRAPRLNRGPHRDERWPRVDGLADRVTDNAPRLGVEDHRDVGDAAHDGDIGQVCHP
jgi:hypothetical protein